jgi:putative endonuclease
MEYFVYYLYSEKLKKYYLGQTDALDYRLWEHSVGKETFSKTGSPWKLVGYIQCQSRSEAVKLETRLKRSKNKKYVLWYIETNGVLVK